MVSCPLCLSPKTKRYINNISSVYSDKTYHLYKCSSCHNIFTYPQPSHKTLFEIYTNNYAYEIHSQIFDEKTLRAKYLSRIIEKSGHYKNILEVGCMYGHLITELNIKYQVAGIEIDKKAVKHCQRQRLNVIKSSLENYLKKNKSKYDLVILSHSLEHILNPKKEISQIRQLLNKQGKILILVPNSDSFCSKIFMKYWGYWQVPIHLNHFNQQSLSYFLKSNGLKPKLIKKYGGDSLMFLSTLANIFKLKKTKNNKLSNNFLIKLSSAILKYWIYIGNDDLLIISQKK